MEGIKRSIAQTIILIFFAVAFAPLVFHPIVVQSSSVTDTNTVAEVGKTIWEYRLAEIYFHAIFLAVAIIASILVIRKPPTLLTTIEHS